MSSPSDSELIESYAKGGDEAAFAELVARYAGLVYGVAVRKVGEALADEVVQNTFVKLGDKAVALDASRGLAAWLHRVASGEAANAVRKERRRRNAMQRYTEHLDDQAADPDLLPVLDEALVDLGRAEQQLVMMRFFESLSFREIGLRLGTSEEAGRKRVSRALDKLGKRLGRRLGRAVPAAGLGATLAAALESEAPSAVVASASAISVGSASASLGFAAIMKTSPVAFVSTIALAATLPVAVQWRASANLDNVAGGAAAAAAPAAEAGTVTAGGAAGTREREAVRPVGGVDLNRLATDLAKIGPDGEPADLLFQLTGQMFDLGDGDLAAVGELLVEVSNREHLGSVITAYFTRWAEIEPRAALDATNDARWGQLGRMARIDAVEVWATQDPEAAVAWCEAQRDDVYGSILKMCVYRKWAVADPHAAMARTHDLPAERGEAYRRELLSVWVGYAPDDAIGWASEIESETERTRMIEYALENLSQQNAAAGFAMAREIADPILRADTLRYALMQWRFSPVDAARGFLSLPEADRDDGLAEDVLGWLRIEHPFDPEDPEALLRDWLAGRVTEDEP